MTDVLSMRLSLTPGLLLMTALFVALLLWINNKATNSLKKLVICSIVILYVSSNLFPWDTICQNRIGNLFVQIQFPFRYLGFVCLTLSVLLCLVINNYDANEELVVRRVAYAVFIVLLVIQVAFDTSSYANDVVSIYNPQYSTDLSKTNVKEYFRYGSDFDKLTYEVSGDEVISGKLVGQNGSDYTFEIEMKNEGNVTLPIMNYKNYKAYDDQGNTYAIVDGEQNEISISLPTNFKGEIYIHYEETIYWRMAEIISFISLIIFLGFLIYIYNRKMHDK